MITANNICEAWIRLLREVMENGEECAPRGKKIVELLHTQVTITDLRNNILTHPLRDLNFRFMIGEWIWIQSGRRDVAWIEKYNKQIAQFSDDGITFRGAYGPRLAMQVPTLLNLLRKDADTRQAVVRIFNDVDLSRATKDVPCTLSLQLLLRQGKLHSVMTMRSNDLWLGFPYDAFNFSQLTNSIAGELGVETGSFTLQAGSSHLYEQDWDKVQEVLECYVDKQFFERSPKLERILPPDICKVIDFPNLPDSILAGLTQQEMMYVGALQCPTKAKCLEVLRTL
jgi:thymidylate synthase